MYKLRYLKFASKIDKQKYSTGYVTYLCNEYPGIVDEAIGQSEEYMRHLVDSRVSAPVAIDLTTSQAAELLVGRASMSQRGYKQLKSVFQTQVKFPRYEHVSRYIRELNVGAITLSKDDLHQTHMCIKSSVSEIIHLALNGELEKATPFTPYTQQKQKDLFKRLKDTQLEVYDHLDPSRPTLLIRQTGDNFRAAGRQPTEQFSFSLLNFQQLTSNPYGQFVTHMWRGGESRSMLEGKFTIKKIFEW